MKVSCTYHIIEGRYLLHLFYFYNSKFSQIWWPKTDSKLITFNCQARGVHFLTERWSGELGWNRQEGGSVGHHSQICSHSGQSVRVGCLRKFHGRRIPKQTWRDSDKEDCLHDLAPEIQPENRAWEVHEDTMRPLERKFILTIRYFN